MSGKAGAKVRAPTVGTRHPSFRTSSLRRQLADFFHQAIDGHCCLSQVEGYTFPVHEGISGRHLGPSAGNYSTLIR